MKCEKNRQVLSEMLQQRGYTITVDTEEYILGEKKDQDDSIGAFPVPTIKFDVKRLQEYIGVVSKLQIKKCIVVYVDSITPVARTTALNESNIEIEIFKNSEIQFNLTKHRLVPKHELLSEKETLKLKKKIDINDLPIILRSDPVARFYNFKVGSVIRIHRNDKYISYRIVKK